MYASIIVFVIIILLLWIWIKMRYVHLDLVKRFLMLILGLQVFQLWILIYNGKKEEPAAGGQLTAGRNNFCN